MADSSQSPTTNLELNGTPEEHNVLAQFGDGSGAALGGRGSVPGVSEGESLHLLREDAFDLAQEFVWERDARVFEEVEEMVRLTFGGGVNRNKHRNQFVKSCFELICSLAWQECAAHEPRTDKVSLYKLLATAVEGVVQHYHLKAYARDRLFAHLPERNWPTDVLAKVEQEKAKTPKQDWLNQAAHAELRTRSVDEQRAVLFGLKVYNTAKITRSFIISRLNGTWVDAADLPSGNTRSDYFKALLHQLWPSDCHRRAVQSTLKANTREGRAVQALTTAQKIYAVDTARQKNLDAGEREWGESWRPTHWLTWVMVGVPCTEYEGFVMDTLAVGRPGTQAETTEALAGRQQRRAARRAGGGGGGAPGDGAGVGSAGGAVADKVVRHELHHLIERRHALPLSERATKIRKLQQQEALLNKQISLL
ncbi:hypothetical protein B484DRAFT_82241, partial [Ochromonadaceae sp. CCMP2298]